MKMKDQREIAAPRAQVWAALQSPEVLKECVPGAQEVSGTVEDGFAAVVVQKVGPVKATFKGHVTMSNMVDGVSLHLAGEGKGGAAGFAKGGADVTLADSETGTLLTYEVEARVGGKLAQMGSRIIDGFAKKMADQFFTNLQNALEEPEGDEVTVGEDDGQEDGGQKEDSDHKKGWFRKLTGR